MPAVVHVSQILPGKKEEVIKSFLTDLESRKERMGAYGLTRVMWFCTPEMAGDGDGLLVAVFEGEDPSGAVAAMYADERSERGKQYNHGNLLAPHDHAIVPQNVAFLELQVTK
jgi:hypothetical protein